MISDDGDGAIVLGPGDAPATVLARDQTPLAIGRVAVRIVGLRTEDTQVVVILRDPHHAVVGDVAEDQITAAAEIGRTFGPAEAGGHPLDTTGAWAALEPCFVDHFDVWVGIA
jgi:hypothetical protein